MFSGMLTPTTASTTLPQQLKRECFTPPISHGQSHDQSMTSSHLSTNETTLAYMDSTQWTQASHTASSQSIEPLQVEVMNDMTLHNNLMLSPAVSHPETLLTVSSGVDPAEELNNRVCTSPRFSRQGWFMCISTY